MRYVCKNPPGGGGGGGTKPLSAHRLQVFHQASIHSFHKATNTYTSIEQVLRNSFLSMLGQSDVRSVKIERSD